VHADINLCHSDLFPSQTELKIIGHVPDSKSSDILSDGPVKYILTPAVIARSITLIYRMYQKR
jgi:hypothetical protein